MVAGRRIECFWVEETGESMFSLRRYWAARFVDGQSREERRTCPGRYGYCNAVANIGRMPTRRDERGFLDFIRPEEFADNSRWPTRCPDCGRQLGPLTAEELTGVSAFDDRMRAQVNQEPIYRAADGREWQMNRLAPGAMLHAEWSTYRGVGPDGICLLVVCPYPGDDARSGMWLPDCPSSDGTPWTRTGDPRNPPTLTVRPSILFATTDGSGYHAFLTDGVLADC